MFFLRLACMQWDQVATRLQDFESQITSQPLGREKPQQGFQFGRRRYVRDCIGLRRIFELVLLLARVHDPRLSTVATDFDKKLSHVQRSTGTTKPIDGAGAGADTGLDTMAEARKLCISKFVILYQSRFAL